MKSLTCKVEGLWKEIKPVKLTEEEISLLNSLDEKDIEAQKVLRDEYNSKRFVVAENTDSKIAQAKYESIKPQLKEKDIYQLISVDVSLDNGYLSGILNCRVNGEHKQVRF